MKKTSSRRDVIRASELAATATCEQRAVFDARFGVGKGERAARMSAGDAIHAAKHERAQAEMAGASDRRCFIATCVYGADAPATEALRRWRDAKLAPSRTGRAAVAVYYAVSPLVVRLLDARPALREPVRRALDAFVRIVVKGGAR